MSDMNMAMISGRLGAEPEIKAVGDDGTMAAMRLAVSRHWKDDADEWHTITEWHRVVTFRKALIDKVLSQPGLKGRRVIIKGRVRAREYLDDGTARRAHEIEIGPDGTLFLLANDKPGTSDPDTSENPENGTEGEAGEDATGSAETPPDAARTIGVPEDQCQRTKVFESRTQKSLRM